ncbi:TonB-dependent siderophore receptor [Oceanicoccus sp. KOV_DT_Chl]|uniref:TonB-dependent receptor plug domain-containing protein n=1 Tax=Oceanicoccus sp. KOV_DT_Chl TaxID=1904639 RepID=UPI0013573191|nr:TonB-dependent receptor [Oceanicoccus sp. KOV_DT_Chl]
MKQFSKLMLVLSGTVIASSPTITTAQETANNDVIEEVMILGSRSAERSASDLPVPVDVFSAEEFSSVGGGADITDNLNALVPSYLAAPATGDGSSFVRPTSLRGMASDQTLVLVNGKRRHRSALVQLFAPAANNGSHGPDVGMIPSIALDKVEVLRDGASSQYGSDAIAGVINFGLKNADEGGSVQLRYGEHFEGESSWRFGANGGFSLGGKGFANLSFETNDNEALSRGNQRPDGQALIDAGVPGVGADAQYGEEPLIQTWGRPETSGTRFVLNTGYDINDTMTAYLFGNYAKTDGSTRFFYRGPEIDASDQNLQDALTAGATNLGREELAGYTPYFEGEQTDFSIVVGLKGDFGQDSNYDVSVSNGSNELDYTLRNSLNGDAPLIGTNAQRDFDPGAYEQEEFNVTVDLYTKLNESLGIAYGAEYREEEFTQIVGEEASYIGGGSSGFGGLTPENAGSSKRDNYAVYVDIEQEFSDAFMLQYALRYEDFSDFGDTINGKLAGRYTLTDRVTLRAAVSTGFHAPTPGQANLRSSTTTFDNMNNLIIVGLLPADDPEVIARGGAPLKEEEAVNLSMGITGQLGEATSITLDAYQVEVDDRIYRNEVAVDGISFYTNALDVKHSGIDLVLTSAHDWSGDVNTDFILAYGYGKVEVTGNKRINGVPVVSDDTVEDIENNYPQHKWTATANTSFSPVLNLLLRARYIGEHYDERGNISGTSSAGASKEIDGIVYVDLELSYDVTDELRLAVGGSNIFDEYPTEIKSEPGQANRNSVGLQYPRRSVQNYEGGSWYLQGTYTF